jgi:hypothetical protein
VNNIAFEAGAGILATRALLASAVRIFGKSGQTAESSWENRKENKWEAELKRQKDLALVRVYAERLTNYTTFGGSFTCEAEEVSEYIQRCFRKARKWCKIAYGLGRVFLVPYVIGDKVYLDIIPQSKEVTLQYRGDEVLGFVAISDTRKVGNQIVVRLTHYEYNPDAHEFYIEHRAMRYSDGSKVELSSIPEWATINPKTKLYGIDKPLFAVVDCPKDGLDGDREQGVPITYGADWLEEEIRETMRDYRTEFQHKKSVLGIDRNAISKDNMGALPREYIKMSTGGKIDDPNSLFSVYSPDIRSQPFVDRVRELFGIHESITGTSRGILTRLESLDGTATAVRRGMFDVIALTHAMRENIEQAFDILAYACAVWLDILGRRVTTDYTIRWMWSDEIVRDPVEEFQIAQQGHSARVVSDAELRHYIFPNETMEEAEAAIKKIKESQPYYFEDGEDGDGGEDEVGV